MTNPSSILQSHASSFHGRKQSVRLVQDMPQLHAIFNGITSQRTNSTSHAREYRDQSVIDLEALNTDSSRNGLTATTKWLEERKRPSNVNDDYIYNRDSYEHKTSVFGAQSKLMYDDERRDRGMIEYETGNDFTMDCHGQLWAENGLKVKSFTELRGGLGWENGREGNTGLRNSSFNPRKRFYAAREDIEDLPSP